MASRDVPPCFPGHREGECSGCLWERECRYAEWVITGRGRPRAVPRNDERGDER